MSDRRLSRFLHLERRRPADADADGAAPTAGRFASMERPHGRAAAGAAPRTGAALERFAPEPEPPLALAAADPERLPFTRCMRCGADSNVFAAACGACGASLDTGEQRAFNERLQAERQAQAAREAAAQAERTELRRSAEAEEAAARRALHEAYTERRGATGQVATGARGGMGEPQAPPSSMYRADLGWRSADPTPPALRLLALARNPATRAGLIGGLSLALGLLFLAFRALRLPAGAIVGAILLVLLVPARARWRR